jgi:Amt family ammonium transporter
MAAQKRNLMTIAMQSFTICCEVTLAFMIFGYSLSFSGGIRDASAVSPVIGNSSRFFLIGIETSYGHVRAPTIPEPLFFMYQNGFAVFTAAIMCGASADRMKFSSMLLLVALWHLLVYCPIAHSNWDEEGFLNRAGVIDWAGGNVVHISGGISGLVTSLVVGKRYGFGEQKFTPNNILHTITGACLLWVGWIGFNGGSAFAANDQAAIAILNTSVAASCAAFSWILMEYTITRQATVLGMINGSIAGLISITPAAGYVDPTGAFFIGLISGPVCYYGISLKKYFGIDDALDAFGLHGVAGIYGGFMTGLFAKNYNTTGAFYGNGLQLGLQIYGIVVCSGWSVFMTFLILIFVDSVIGLRISVDTEKTGLDRSFHGEGLYAERSKVVTPTERVAELLKSYAEAKAKKNELEIQQALKTKKRVYRDGPVSDDSSLTNSEIDHYPERAPISPRKEFFQEDESKIKRIEFASNETKDNDGPPPIALYHQQDHDIDLDDDSEDSYQVGVGRNSGNPGRRSSYEE